MIQFLSYAVAFLTAVGMLSGNPNANAVWYNFEKDDAGFTPIFSDYPDSEGSDEFYELRHEYAEIPIEGAGKGLFISGNNHSDDLFMGYVKKIDGFSPNTAYRFDVCFKLATDVDGGMMGIGGAPGEAVSVKCGIVTTEPRSEVNKAESGNTYRMNIDTGKQHNGGKDMVLVGDIAKTMSWYPEQYEFKEFQTGFDVTTNENGEVWLIIATDSGFEGTTSYYLDDIIVRWEKAE